MKDINNLGHNDTVQQSICWIKPEYKAPRVRNALYLVIFSGKMKNTRYDHAIATAFYDNDGWFIETAYDIEDLEVFYYADVPIPKECESYGS